MVIFCIFVVEIEFIDLFKSNLVIIPIIKLKILYLQKGGVPFGPQLPVQPAAPLPGAPLPAAYPAVQPVTQPPPIFPTFLQNIMQAKKDIISGKFAAIQPPTGSFGSAVQPGSLNLEDVELAEEYVDPATASKNNILASILKLSGPLSSSSSEYNDE